MKACRVGSRAAQPRFLGFRAAPGVLVDCPALPPFPPKFRDIQTLSGGFQGTLFGPVLPAPRLPTRLPWPYPPSCPAWFRFRVQGLELRVQGFGFRI